jgi:hypothetical protein
MKHFTDIEFPNAQDEALGIENKIERIRVLQSLCGRAPHGKRFPLVNLCVALSREIINDVANLNGLKISRYKTTYFSQEGGIISPARLSIQKMEKIIAHSEHLHFIDGGVSRENIADHGYVCLDEDGYSVILAAPYGTTTQIREKFQRVVGSFSVELQFSPGDGFANHHTPRHSRGIAIRSAKTERVIWPDYYHEYAELIVQNALPCAD